MKGFTKKSLAVALAIVLVLSLSITAFAAWPSFQNTNSNNGVIATQPPITTPKTSYTVPLPANGTFYSGVDATSVVDASSSVVYTLYNGGDYTITSSGVTGGATLAATELTTGTAPTAPAWTYVVDSKAGNNQQLSTPYLATSSTLYAAITYYSNELVGTGLEGWTDASGTPIGSLTVAAGTSQTVTYSGLILPSAFYSPQLTVTSAGASSGLTGSVTLTPAGGGTAINWGTSSYYGDPWTLYNLNGTLIPAGTYDLTFTINNTSGSSAINITGIEYLDTRWALHQLSGFTASTAPTSNAVVASGYGQANTPISYDSSGHVYFGIYEGDRAYYQYNTSGGAGALVEFKPSGGDDFYGAGAAFIPDSVTGEGDAIVFGSDSGTLYVRPVTNFATGTGNTYITKQRIRSSVAIANDSLYGYFTSSSTIWQFKPPTVFGPLSIGGAILPSGITSTSTPVASLNGHVYVGYNNGFASGGVIGVSAGSFYAGGLFDVYGNAINPSVGTPGDPVQSSPIVWSTDEDEDYIYFTTNSGSGKGYCYYFDTSTPAVPATQKWVAGGTSSNPYAVQGFASDGGYLVYGDDGNYLYIMH
jgi:hypothetical protein